jgi:hypothetical protein
VSSAVLPVEASPASRSEVDAVDVRHLRNSVIVLRPGDGLEHVLLRDDTFGIQLELRKGSLLEGPVRLRYDIAGFDGVGAKLTTLHRLLALRRLRRFPRSLFPPERRAHRWIVALRALDASRAGANPREIAAGLFGQDTVRTDWHSESDYLRSRVRRAVTAGEQLANSGYLSLLSQ